MNRRRPIASLLALLLTLPTLAPAAYAQLTEPRPGTPPTRPTQRPSPTPTPRPSPAPQEEDDSEDDVVRITANLVQFDTVVTDREGRQVTDLRPEDFEVLVDGKPQDITNFAYVSTESGTVSPKPVAAAKGAPAPPPAPPARLRPEQVRRTVALVVDDLGTSFESMAFARRALKKFVDEDMRPGDLVAIMRTSAGVGALQQFTADKQLLYKAIERVRWYPMGRSGVGAFAPLEGKPLGTSSDVVGGDASRESSRELDRFREDLFSVGTLGALNFIIRGMRELPGRKAVVMFSDGFKIYNRDDQEYTARVVESLRRLTDLANRAAVTVYTVDARGLVAPGLTAADNTSGLTPTEIEQAMEGRAAGLVDTQEGLEYLARQTGGAFVRNTNDLGQGIRRALEDQKGYYLIGFRPAAELFGTEQGRARFNRFEVKVRRAGLKTNTRGGFYGFTEGTARPVRRTRGEQMLAALTSPFTSGGLDLKLTTLFSSPGEQATYMDSLLHLNMGQFKFADEADGWKKATVDVVAIIFGENGQVVDQINRTENVRAKDDALRSILTDGLVYVMRVPVKKPGAYQLRVAVRDAATEKLGSASQYIEVPDLGKKRLALSGIILTSSPENRPAVPEGAFGNPPLRDAALRRFPPGGSLDFSIDIFNAVLDRATSRPQLQVQTRLFREGQPVYEGRPQPVGLANQTDMKRLVFASRLRLGPALVPGDYVLQVVVTDLLAKEKQRVTTQWIDFEVVK
ncbi:MAG TPA: VWA domain-containing protein [Pyrinomonadaceae bacterium]|jgi:VWFA-related protein|nr:VWA domain-containing protein [Pyrinomonadaceae bacterium]